MKKANLGVNGVDLSEVDNFIYLDCIIDVLKALVPTGASCPPLYHRAESSGTRKRDVATIEDKEKHAAGDGESDGVEECLECRL